jgi:hypothetical protein
MPPGVYDTEKRGCSKIRVCSSDSYDKDTLSPIRAAFDRMRQPAGRLGKSIIVDVPGQRNSKVFVLDLLQSPSESDDLEESVAMFPPLTSCKATMQRLQRVSNPSMRDRRHLHDGTEKKPPYRGLHRSCAW